MQEEVTRFENRLAALLEEALEEASLRIGAIAKAEVVDALTEAFAKLTAELDEETREEEEEEEEDCSRREDQLVDAVLEALRQSGLINGLEAEEDDEEGDEEGGDERVAGFVTTRINIGPKDVDPRVQEALKKVVEFLTGPGKPSTADKDK